MSNLFSILIDENKEFNNSELAEFIEVIKKSGKIEIIRDVFSEVKEEYFVEDKIHGITHNERVAILAAYMGIKEGLSDSEFKILLQAAIYHDIGRKDKTQNENHGDRSARIIEENKNNIFPHISEEEIKIIKALSICHNHNDEKMQDIARENGVSDITSFIKIARILKDADGLDRERLKFGKLDIKYLRTEISKRIIHIAQELYYESISVENLQEDRKLDTRIEDEEYIYLFRALTDENIRDRKNGIRAIRPNSVREYEKTGEWREYSNESELTLEELYKHTRTQYKHCYTNCISLTEDPSVTLTYNTEIAEYVIIRVPKRSLEYSRKIYDSRKYFVEELKKVVEEAEKTEKIEEIFLRIEGVRSNEELRKILRDFKIELPTSFITDRQYLEKREELEYHKIIAKLKILEENELIGNIVEGIGNNRIYSAIGNAFTSAEYIHYGTIEEENVIECSRIHMDIFSLLGQVNGVDKEKIERLTQKIIQRLENKDEVELLEKDRTILEHRYTGKRILNNELTIEQAYNLTEGQISYVETRMQITAIRTFVEMLLRKRTVIDYLKREFPEEGNLEEIFENTYCINPEFSLKQNGRGHQLTNTVNFVATDSGIDLENVHISQLIERISELNDEQLKQIYENGISSEELRELLIQTREHDERIKQYKGKDEKTQYIAEAIVEGYDWKKIRGALTVKEKEKLVKKITAGIQKGDLEKLYSTLSEIYLGENNLTQEEIFAIIINIAIEGKLGEISYKEIIKLPKEEQKRVIEENADILQTRINPITIDLMMKRGKTIVKLKQSLIEMGIEEGFLKDIDERNIYTAKEIVDGYNWEEEIGRKLESEEKGAIIQAILRNKNLERNKGSYLSTLVRNISRLGLSEQEVYGAIINLGINEKVLQESGYGYNSLLNNKNEAFKTIVIYKYKIETKVSDFTIQKALSSFLTKEAISNIEQQLEKLGIDKDFIKQKDNRNLYIAKRIVEEYDFGRELTKEEKRVIIKCILDKDVLKESGTAYLSTLVKNLRKSGYNQQQTNGIIINLAINGNVLDDLGFSYSSLLIGKKTDQELSKYNIETEVNEITIQVALSKNISEEEEERIKKELEELGINRGFIDRKDIRNIYMAKRIVEEYDFGRGLTQMEKRVIIEAILSSSKLDSVEKAYYLSSLMQKLLRIGLTNQEVYGTIINLGFNESVTEETEYSYSALLGSKKKCQELSKYNMETEVKEITIQAALSKNISEEEEEKIKKELEELGINRGFIDRKDIRNIYMAKRIVEEYDFNRKLTQEEKRVIIQAILNKACLEQKKSVYLYTLVDYLQKIGLSEQEVYGAIINLGINGRIIEETGYGYSDLLSNRDGACLTIKKYKEKIRTTVSDDCIEEALNNNIGEEEE